MSVSHTELWTQISVGYEACSDNIGINKWTLELSVSVQIFLEIEYNMFAVVILLGGVQKGEFKDYYYDDFFFYMYSHIHVYF